MKQSSYDNNAEIEEKSYFRLFKVNIQKLWKYFIQPSFIATYFAENCKVTNIKNFNRELKEKDILEVFFPDKNIKAKVLFENITESQNSKFISLCCKFIDHQEDLSPFFINFNFYYCSYTNVTGVHLKIISEKNKSNFILDFFYENEGRIFKNIEKYIEIEFKEIEETESIAIRKSGDKVFNFFTAKNYANLKILLGNNAAVNITNNPNIIEIEHFTKNNKVKFIVSKNIDFNEKQISLKPIESQLSIPRQLIIIKVVNINENDCLVLFTHKIKEYISNDLINNYSLLKKKLLWLLKSKIEGKNE